MLVVDLLYAQACASVHNMAEPHLVRPYAVQARDTALWHEEMNRCGGPPFTVRNRDDDIGPISAGQQVVLRGTEITPVLWSHKGR